MENFEAYKRKMYDRLLQWDAEVKLLEARLREMTADKRIEHQKDIEELKAKITKARADLKKFSESGEEVWKAFKEKLDEAWDILADGFRNARSKF